jgi:hypothetical protein
MQHFFTIERAQGTYDSSKWAIPLGFVTPKLARRCATRWHSSDLARSYSVRTVTSSLRVSFLLRKKELAA